MAIYCPPRSRKQRKLINYIIDSYHFLKASHPSAYLLLGGDVYSLNWTELMKMSQSMQQCVTKPTRKGKILSILITDLHNFYSEVEIRPLLKPDIEGVGKPSDHDTAFFKVN